jgi:hypothetical protein
MTGAFWALRRPTPRVPFVADSAHADYEAAEARTLELERAGQNTAIAHDASLTDAKRATYEAQVAGREPP